MAEHTTNAEFLLGQCSATPGALAVVAGDAAAFFPYLDRHTAGDWGELDAEDKQRNDDALRDGDRILSRYTLPTGEPIYIITEWDRSRTTVMLTEEY